MKLSEIVVTRALARTPHPMVSKMWMVVPGLTMRQGDLKAAWIFKTEAAAYKALRSPVGERVIHNIYSGDYAITVKTDNGIHMLLIVGYGLVREMGTALTILSVGMTEKSAMAAAKKVTEAKGHTWDPGAVWCHEFSNLDPSIFDTEEEDLEYVIEGLGKDALRFADYLASFDATPLAKLHMKELALMLLRRDFKLLTKGGVRLNDDPPDSPGFGFSFMFPDDSSGHQRMGVLTILYTAFKEDRNGAMAFHKWTSHYSASEILGMGLDKFMDHARAMAKPIK